MSYEKIARNKLVNRKLLIVNREENKLQIAIKNKRVKG